MPLFKTEKPPVFTSNEEMRHEWQALGGANADWTEFYQKGKLNVLKVDEKVMVTVTVKNQNKPVNVVGGVCKALCLRFMDNRKQNMDWRASAQDLDSTFNVSMTHQAKITKHVVNKHESLGGNVGAVSGGSFWSRAVKSRSELVKTILAQPGLYIYEFSNFTGNGHAVAFDTRNGEFHFFNPDSGYYFTNSTPDATLLTAFIRKLWDTMSYKKKFHHGPRWLVAY